MQEISVNNPPIPGLPRFSASMMKLWSNLTVEQRQVIEYIVRIPFFGIFMDMGNGKTLAMLVALMLRQPSGHILIVAPKNIAKNTWTDDIEKFGLPFRVQSLALVPAGIGKSGRPVKAKDMTGAQRHEIFEQMMQPGYPPTLFVISRDNFHDMVEYFATKGHRNKTSEYKYWPVKNIVIDESQSVKSPSSRLFKAFKHVRPYLDSLYELSGTPSPEEIGDIWAQAYLLDRGQALTDSKSRFRDIWFRPLKTNDRGQVIKWSISPENEQDILNRIHHMAIYSKNAKLDTLPPAIIADHRVSLPADVMTGYKKFKKDADIQFIRPGVDATVPPNYPDWESYLNDPNIDNITRDLRQKEYDKVYRSVVAVNRAVLRNKLIQYANGSLYQEIGPEDPAYPELTVVTKRPSLIVHNEKIKELIQLLNDHAGNDGSPVLIAFRFQSDRDRIVYHLTRAGYPVKVFDGSPDTLKAWNNREIPVMLIHPASAGHGLNFQAGGHTMVWFSLPDSHEHYAQTNARLRRMGQTEQVTIHRLITSDTYDSTLPGILREKKNQQRRTMNSLVREFRDI